MPAFHIIILSTFLLFIASPITTSEIFHVHKKTYQNPTAVLHRSNARHLSNELPVEGYNDYGMYYTEIEIGAPSKNYTVQVDTGSSLMWVYCQNCKGCYNNSYFQQNEYDPNASETSHVVEKGEEVYMCENYEKTEEHQLCPFETRYIDGTNATGYYVTDIVGYKNTKTNMTFGCITSFAGDARTNNDAGVEGVLGFGDTEESLISNLGASGKVKKVFSHCLDTQTGSGFFATGDVVNPKMKNMVPYIPNNAYYDLMVDSVEIGDTVLNLTGFDDVVATATLDSGSTSSILPDPIYDVLLKKLGFEEGHGRCFSTEKDDVDEFPDIVFHFSMAVKLVVRPRDYMISFNNLICLLWTKGSKLQTSNVLLGDNVLSKKLVVYDLEKKMIGWIDYDCSLSIEVE